MAEKKIFIVSEKKIYVEDIVCYDYTPGFAVSQKQKSISSLHSRIAEKYPNKRILEISTKSEDEIGVLLSAFSLKFWHEELQEYRTLENVFQSSKKFVNGGPYKDLLNVHPRDAKKDIRLNNSGDLQHFELYGEKWELEPQTMFYDWIYINALARDFRLKKEILKYDIFTDIEFNHNKSINCQARSAAIYVGLKRKGQLEEALASQKNFKKIYEHEEQLSFF